MRLFLAIDVPGGVQAALAETQAQLRNALEATRVRWTPAGQFHLTLLFFGEVADERAGALIGNLKEAAGGFGALQLNAESVGVFPERGTPRVIWAGVREAQGRLLQLHRLVAECARDFIAGPASERFAGHITLGRARELSRPQSSALIGRTESLKARRFGAWTVDAIKLMRSQLAADGARHSLLAPIAL